MAGSATAMQITTDYSQLALSYAGVITPGTGASSSDTSSAAVDFGAPAQVTLSGGESITGFTDYTQLGANGLWQFDLTRVLTPQTTGIPQDARSPAEQKADDAAVKQALTLIDQGQLDQARTLMNGLLAENKTNAAAVHALGAADLADGKYQSAQQLFLKAQALDPTAGYDREADDAGILQQDDTTVLDRAQSFLTDSSRQADAVQLLKGLTARSPKNTTAHMLLADALLKQNDALNGLLQYDAAVGSATQAELPGIEQQLAELARQAPKSGFLQQLVGKAQIREGRFEDALAALDRADEINGSDAGTQRDRTAALVGYGRQLLAGGDVTGALLQFQNARDLSPTNADAKTALAEGYVAQAEHLAGQQAYADAADLYAKVVTLLGDKGNDDLRKEAAAGAYAVGRSLENRRIAANGEIGKEVVAYQAAHDLDGDNLTYRDQLAKTRNALGDQYAADGKLKDAAYSYQSAYQLNKTNATYKANAQAAFVRWGDDASYNLRYDDAVTAYREAYRIDTFDVANKRKLADAYNTRGLDHYSNERMAKAASDFKNALLLFPDDPGYQQNFDLVKGWA